MIVPFRDITKGGKTYNLSEIHGFATDDNLIVKGPVHAVCRLSRKSDRQVIFAGRIACVLEIICDRCLEPFDFSINTEINLILEIESVCWEIRELECSRKDLDTLLLPTPHVDLGDIFRQHVYLALPMKQLCSEACAGLCPFCGTNRNLDPCDCGACRPASPFAVLASIRGRSSG